MTPTQTHAAFARMAGIYCTAIAVCIIAGIAARVWLGAV